MFCRNRERIFVDVADFILSCERNRRGLQVSTDWSNDVWYLWLAADPEHLALSRRDYVNPRDFADIFRFVRAGGRPRDYRITALGTVYYMLFRSTGGGASAMRGALCHTMTDGAQWPLCIDNELFADGEDEEEDVEDGKGRSRSSEEADALLGSPGFAAVRTTSPVGAV